MQKTELCFDLFTNRYLKWMQPYHPKRIDNRGNPYYTIVVPYADRRKIIWKARLRGIRFRYYEKRWSRSTNYREAFFQNNRPPYFCRYCNRPLTANTMVIDHIVPVAKAKTSPYARMILSWQGIDDVNDVRNLAPSCRQCNSKKSDKMGLWCLEGWLGKYLNFRKISLVIICILVVIVCIMISQLFMEMGVFL